MKYRKFVPDVPGHVPATDDTGNMQNTPVKVALVPDVPDVPVQSRDTYTTTVCGECGDSEGHTHHTKVCKGGVLVSGTGNTGTKSFLQVVELVPGDIDDREQNREQTGNMFPPTEHDDLPFGDLTQWIGHTVDADTLAELEAEAYRRYAGALIFPTALTPYRPSPWPAVPYRPTALPPYPLTYPLLCSSYSASIRLSNCSSSTPAAWLSSSSTVERCVTNRLTGSPS